MTYRRCICHPDDLPGVGISSGWVTANSLCHPDDILFYFMSSGWLNWGWFLIRMSYGNVIMSSGWDTLPFLSHPDEIANFDFPQHAVALQRFRTTAMISMQHKIVNMLDPQSHHNPQPKRSSSGTLNMWSHHKTFTLWNSLCQGVFPWNRSNGCSLNWFTPSEFFQFSQLSN